MRANYQDNYRKSNRDAIALENGRGGRPIKPIWRPDAILLRKGGTIWKIENRKNP